MRFILFTILLFSVTYSFADGLCGSDEKVYFSCVTNNKKTISICGSSKLTSKARSYIQYRYGKSNNIELEYPSDRDDSLNSFFYTHYFRSQYNLTELEFTNSNYKYTVFWTYDGESAGKKKTSAGVRIKKVGEEQQFVVNCGSDVDMNLSKLEGHVSCNKSNPLAFCQ